MSPRQLELLGILQEECAEVIQIISKIRRFGIHSFNPGIENCPTNAALLNLEVGDVLAMIEMIKEVDGSYLNEDQLEQRIIHKKQKVVRYLQSPE